MLKLVQFPLPVVQVLVNNLVLWKGGRGGRWEIFLKDQDHPLCHRSGQMSELKDFCPDHIKLLDFSLPFNTLEERLCSNCSFFLPAELHFCEITFCIVVMRALWMLATAERAQDGETVHWYKLNSPGVSPLPCCVNHSVPCIHLLSCDWNKQRRKKFEYFWWMIIKNPQTT